MLSAFLALNLWFAFTTHADQPALPYAYCMGLLNVIAAAGGTDAPDLSVLGRAQRQLNRLSVTFRDQLERRPERAWTREPFRFDVRNTYELSGRDVTRYRELKRRLSDLRKDLANPERVDQNITRIFIGRDAVVNTVVALPRVVETIDEDLLIRLGAQHPDSRRERERGEWLESIMGLAPLLSVPTGALAYHASSASVALLASGVLAGAAAYLNLNPLTSLRELLRHRRGRSLTYVDGDRQASREEATFYRDLHEYMKAAHGEPNGFFAFGTRTQINAWDKLVVDVGGGQTTERTLGDQNFPYSKYAVDLDRIGFYDQVLREPVLILAARIRRD